MSRAKLSFELFELGSLTCDVPVWSCDLCDHIKITIIGVSDSTMLYVLGDSWFGRKNGNKNN